MSTRIPRRRFLQKSLATAVAAPAVLSFEERNLIARAGQNAAVPAASTGPRASNWMGRIGDVEISRLICGGNLISGYAHSRDLIYVSKLLTHYFDDERIMQTWRLCEQHGINTMIFNPDDAHAVAVYRTYRKQGGKIQFLAQVNPRKEDLRSFMDQIVGCEPVGAFLVGNAGDAWSRDGKVDEIARVVELIKDAGMIAGVAGHEVRTPQVVEKAGIPVDFYVKTLHHANYWSSRRPDQTKDVIDNYGADNYWCKDPEETVGFMAGVRKPWIAYKVLAAGAIPPKSGFKHAFANGADFALVGMFDFQVIEDVAVAHQILSAKLDRRRAWLA